MYETYGDVSFIRDQFDSMVGWVDYVATVTHDADLFTGCWTYGDWLALDHPEDYVAPDIETSKRGASDDGLVCSAFYDHSLDLVILAGKALGRDVSEYEARRARTAAALPDAVSRTG